MISSSNCWDFFVFDALVEVVEFLEDIIYYFFVLFDHDFYLVVGSLCFGYVDICFLVDGLHVCVYLY